MATKKRRRRRRKSSKTSQSITGVHVYPSRQVRQAQIAIKKERTFFDSLREPRTILLGVIVLCLMGIFLIYSSY